MVFQTYVDDELMCQGTNLYNPTTQTMTLPQPITWTYNGVEYPVSLAQGARHMRIVVTDKGGLSSTVEADYTAVNTWIGALLLEANALLQEIPNSPELTPAERAWYTALINAYVAWNVTPGVATIQQGVTTYEAVMTASSGVGYAWDPLDYQELLTYYSQWPNTSVVSPLNFNREPYTPSTAQGTIGKIVDWFKGVFTKKGSPQKSGGCIEELVIATVGCRDPVIDEPATLICQLCVGRETGLRCGPKGVEAAWEISQPYPQNPNKPPKPSKVIKVVVKANRFGTCICQSVAARNSCVKCCCHHVTPCGDMWGCGCGG